MFNELETQQLAAMVDTYGPKGVVDALATECAKRSDTVPEATLGAAWGHDTIVLQRTIRRLWIGGKGRT
jgi:hypothetical protein